MSNKIWRCNLLPQYKAHAQEIDEAIHRVLNSGQYILSEEVSSFEREFAEYIGSAHAVGCASGTDALVLAMMSLGIGAKDEVITTPFTAIPTVSAIIQIGATPVFVDIDPNTYLIDLDRINEKIRNSTKAIIPVHIFGNVVDVSKLRSLIGQNIPIIEDACQSHGSIFKNKQSGSMGDAGVFSFYPTKNLGGYGDGGMVVTNNKKYAEKLKLMRQYGMTDKDHTVILGINSRLDELQAAILRVKLKYLDEMNRKRKQIVKRYIEEFPNELFQYQKIDDDIVPNYHLFSFRCSRRDELIRHLDKNDIQTNIYYLVPQHLQEGFAFLGYKKGDFPMAEKVCDEMITLPMYPEMTQETQTKIIDTIKAFNG